MTEVIENRGVTWFEPYREMAYAAAAALLAVTVLAMSAAPAAAAKPPKDPGDKLALVCDSSTTITLADIAAGIDADAAWAQGLTGAGIDVAVLDTGVNAIASLDGRVIHGPDLSFDGSNDALRNRDLHGHGTNMAAIIAADDTAYGDGIAPGARIINVKVGAGDGAVDVSQVIAGINWVVENKNANGMNIRVLNLAYGTDGDQDYVLDPISYAVENAWRNGIVVIVSAGNEGREVVGLANPATNPFVLAIGGAGKSVENDSGFRAADWTTKGDEIRDPDVIAPGECVVSAGMTGSFLADKHPTSVSQIGSETFVRGTGTSQAASVVSGAVALLLEQRPELTPDQVKSIVRSSTAMLHSNLKKNEIPQPEKIAGTGLLNVANALATPTPSAQSSSQNHTPATGLGTLEGARGSYHVGEPGDELVGEYTVFGTAWNGATWSGATWSGATWSGGTWSGGTWSGATWSGGTWSGATWSGGTWSGGTWSGATWSGGTWSGATWA